MKIVEKKDILVKAPLKELDRVIKSNLLSGKSLNLDLLKKFGVFIIKDLFNIEGIKELRSNYDELMRNGLISKDEYHRTQVRIEGVNFFENFLKEKTLLSQMIKIFPEGFGLDFYRIVKKDKSNPEPVFLHSDACYNIGWYEAYSVFIPLSKCGPDNGGLSFYPGTNNFGHIGDAGGLANILPDNYPVLSPEVDIGDAIIMHAGIWHKSPKFITGEARIYLELNFRSINDPAMKLPIYGIDRRDWVLKISVDDLFLDSREQRIKKLYEKLDHYTNSSI
jgi:hypothetical protein